jgi:nitrate/nitrite transporter NarK
MCGRLIRFFFGVGEAGAYPNITRALHNWFPFKDRGLAQGTVWMCGRLMGGLTPLVWWMLVEELEMSWRAAFCIFGVIGVIWCVAFALWFRNRPSEHPGVNQAELDLIAGGPAAGEPVLVETGAPAANEHLSVPWLKLVKDLNLWALCLMYFCASFGWYFNITYLPRFLETQYDVSPKETLGAIYKGGPLLMGATTCLLGGFLGDRLVRRTRSLRWGRRVFGIIGHSLCGLCYFACLFTPTAFTFALAISFAAFWNDLTMGSAWATCQDIGKRYAAIVAGCMNTIGNLGGAVAGWVTGTILEHQVEAYKVANGISGDLDPGIKQGLLLHGYQISFVMFGLVYGVAVFLWMRIDASRPVADQQG